MNVKFYRGPEVSHSTSDANGIYFATDTHRIWLGTNQYSGSGDSYLPLAGGSLTDNSVIKVLSYLSSEPSHTDTYLTSFGGNTFQSVGTDSLPVTISTDGIVKAKSFVKTNGTVDEILLADGETKTMTQLKSNLSCPIVLTLNSINFLYSAKSWCKVSTDNITPEITLTTSYINPEIVDSTTLTNLAYLANPTLGALIYNNYTFDDFLTRPVCIIYNYYTDPTISGSTLDRTNCTLTYTYSYASNMAASQVAAVSGGTSEHSYLTITFTKVGSTTASEFNYALELYFDADTKKLQGLNIGASL